LFSDFKAYVQSNLTQIIFNQKLSLKYKSHFFVSEITLFVEIPKIVCFGIIDFFVSKTQKFSFLKNVSQI
jgi:hypothetical protein